MSQTIYYRMTVYDATVFSDSTTVLTPSSGSSHSDSFKVTTHPSLSGWQPYMRPPRGERGAFDVMKSTSTVGQYTITLLDKRTDSGNINRWVSAFIGDSNSKLSIIGKKVYIEESTDGSTWSPFFVGRINSIDLSSLLQVSFTVADSLALLKQEIFSSLPRVDYAVFRSVWPLGFTTDLITAGGDAYIRAVAPFTLSAILGTGTGTGADAWRILVLDAKSLNRADNQWGFGSRGPFPGAATVYNTADGRDLFRLVARVGGSYYHYRVVFVNSPNNSYKESATSDKIQQIGVYELHPDDANYSSLSVLGSPYALPEVWVYTYRSEDQSLASFFLNSEPYIITRDILDGKFFQPNLVSLSVPYDSGSLATLATTHVLPDTLYRVKAKTTAATFLEANVCRPYNLGYTLEPVLSGSVPKSVVRFFSTRQPTSLSGISTIASADVISDSRRDWTTEEPVLYAEGTFYMETSRLREASAATDVGYEPTIESSHKVIVGLGDTTNDASYKPVSIDFSGLRGLDPNVSMGGVLPTMENVPSYTYVQNKANGFLRDFFQRHQNGNPRVRLKTARNATTDALMVGDFVLIEVEALPNQATRSRGGTRVMQVVQKSPSGLSHEFEFVDAGVNSTMTVPSLGALSSSTAGVVAFTITTVENANVEIEYAVVAAGGAVPSAGSDSWMFNRVVGVNSTVANLSLHGVPEGRRVYVRIRAVSPITNDLKLSSAWVTSVGLDLAGISPPTGVSVSAITSRSAKVDWSNTNSTYAIEVYLASPAGTPDTLVATLPQGSTTYVLRGLDRDSSTSHRVGIRYTDQSGGFSAFDTADFTASGTAPTLDAPASILLFVSR